MLKAAFTKTIVSTCLILTLSSVPTVLAAEPAAILLFGRGINGDAHLCASSSALTSALGLC